MKSSIELKKLHGEDYVNTFERNQFPRRLGRLTQYIYIEKDYKVADFACGSGLFMEYIAPKVASYVGIDFSGPFIDAAIKKKNQLSIDNAEFVCEEINIFCKTHSQIFDVGFAIDFSEHVYDEEWVEILRSIRGSLKKNGKLYLHTPNADFFMEIMRKHGFFVKGFPGHVAIRTPGHNIALLEKAGFNIRKFIIIPHYNILRFIHPLSHMPLVGKYFKARIFIEATA